MRGGNSIRYLTMGAILSAASLTGLSLRAQQPQANKQAVAQDETEDAVKVDIYTKFVNNYKSNKKLAYQIGKDYLQRYGKDKDRYATYVRDWMAGYEFDERPHELWRVSYTDRNFVEAFKLGKQVLTEQPDLLDSLIALGNAGYIAASARNNTYDKEAIGYASRAIQLIEAGKIPENWEPYKGKDEALAYLYSTVGILELKPTPNEAVEPLFKSTQFESELKKLPSTYYYLAQAYQAGPYKKLSDDYQTHFAGKPETPESKQLLEKLDQVIDLMIDAYARAVALAGNDAQNAQNKATWMSTLTTFYKFRHQNSDAGLTELIAGVVAKPLPKL